MNNNQNFALERRKNNKSNEKSAKRENERKAITRQEIFGAS